MNYAELSGGVSAWGLGGMGATRRGGFGSGGALGGAPQPPAGFGWVVYNDPFTVQNFIEAYTDPTTGDVRPVVGALVMQ